MKKIATIIIITLCFSCKKECNNHEIDNVILEYVDEFMSTIKTNPNDGLIVKVNSDLSNSFYKSYRIHTSAILLDKTQIPNEIMVYKEMKIAFFIDSLTNKQEIDKMKLSLSEKGFYNINSTFVHSNYPEWVLLVKKNNDCSYLVKNTHYRDLNKIIETIEKE